MARLYPRLGSCPRCGGTGRVYSPRHTCPAHALIGDETESCPECRGMGTTVDERREQTRQIVDALRELAP